MKKLRLQKCSRGFFYSVKPLQTVMHFVSTSSPEKCHSQLQRNSSAREDVRDW